MRVLRPADGIVAFYDGRVEGYRFAEEPNWVDDGALSLGHRQLRDRRRRRGAGLRHARLGRARALRARGARGRGRARGSPSCSATGTSTTSPAPRPSPTARSSPRPRTAELLAADRDAIEAGTHRAARPRSTRSSCPPARSTDRMTLDVGRLAPRADPRRHPQRRRRRALAPRASACCSPATRWRTPSPTSPSPSGLDRHLAELERLADLGPERILPNHGDPDVIAGGGYPQGPDPRDAGVHPRPAALPRRAGAARRPRWRELVADSVDAGWITYFAPYEAVHRENVAAVTAAAP